MTPSAPPAGSDLCASCGLCCDGTMFDLVPLRADDALPPLRARGLRIVTLNAVDHLGLPCPAHKGGSCQIYLERPSICRNYRCRVLRRYERGAISWTEARDHVDRAWTLKRAFAAELDRLSPGSPASGSSLAGIAPDDAALAADRGLRQAWAPVLLRFAALRDCLRTHFHVRRPQGTHPDSLK